MGKHVTQWNGRVLMRKHLYLFTSNLDMTRELRKDVDFLEVHRYSSHEISKTHPYEWGRITTSGNYYHIIIGKMRQEGCPWCASPTKIKKISDAGEGNRFYSVYCIQCMSCGSRGPYLNVTDTVEENTEAFGHIKDLMKQRYETRRYPDEDFLNPYGMGGF